MAAPVVSGLIIGASRRHDPMKDNFLLVSIRFHMCGFIFLRWLWSGNLENHFFLREQPVIQTLDPSSRFFQIPTGCPPIIYFARE